VETTTGIISAVVSDRVYSEILYFSR